MGPEELSNRKFVADGVSVDWLLQYVVDLANAGVQQTPVTLTVPAGIVTGVIVGGDQYLEEFRDTFASHWPESASKTFNSLVEEWKQNYQGPIEGDNNAAYIHLKDARICLNGEQLTPAPGMLWRGKINAVTGFTIGLLEDK